MGAESGLDQIIDLSLGCNLPIAIPEITRQTLEPQDGHAVLLRPVEDPVVELGAGGKPELGLAAEVVMLALKVREAVVVTTNGFLN